MWIKREIERIFASVTAESPAILITGMRQTGKTSLLEHAVTGAAFISLDLPQHAEEAEHSGAQLLQRLREPLIIDEVQYAPKFFRALKARIDEERNKNGRFFLTGSQRFDLMRNLSDSLAGRITIIELPSLSAREIVAFQGEPISRESLLDMIWRGGFPELYSTQRNPERFFASYIASYIERDIKQMINVRQERDFDRFLRLCALRAGSLTALNPLAAELGISPTTAKAWFDALVASHVIALAEPFHSNLSKRLIKTPKFYFTDTGLQCALAGLRSKEELQNSSLLGAIFEGHCFGQILRSFQNRALRPRVSFFRDHVGHEIDFVIELGNESHLIECKWSDTPNWSQKNFAKAEEYIQTGRRVTRSVACSTIHERHTDGGVTIRNSLDWEWLHA